MDDGHHTMKFDGTFRSIVFESGVRREHTANYQLTIDVDSLIRQLCTSALLAESKPKKSARALDAVVLTILEESREIV